MPTDHDVVIVGGGPAGAATAYHLAVAGVSVLVCEKEEFPREKSCGDGLTPRAVSALEDMGLEEQVRSWARVRGVRLHADGRAVEFPFPRTTDWCDYGVVVPRRDLDRIVLEHARAAGATVRHRAEVVEPLRDGDTVVGVVVQRDGQRDEIRSRWVVCAEGTATRFSRAIGRARDTKYPFGLAIRQYGRPPGYDPGWFDIDLGVHLGPDLVPGYGWVFPVGDGTVNVGVGLLSGGAKWRGVNLNRLQEAFLGQVPPAWGLTADTVCTRPRAGRLFMGGSVWPPHGPGVLLVGDAAGMINPFTGEGIAYAYETGRIAARHLADALRRGSGPSLPAYTEELKATYGPYFRLGRGFAKAIGNPFVMDKLVAVTMRSRFVLDFALTMLCNLQEHRPTNATQRAWRLLERAAAVRL